jgi:hypothetical protein
MGQSDQYHELLQLLLLMPPGTPKLWNFLNLGVRRLVSCSITDEDEMEDAFRIDMNNLVSMLEKKAEELGAIYPQVSKLAMSVMTKETELRQMKSDVDRSMILLDRVKTEMSESLRAVEDELERRGDNDGFLRQMLAPVMAIPDRHLSMQAFTEEDEEATRERAASMGRAMRRRSSSVTEMRYEVNSSSLQCLNILFKSFRFTTECSSHFRMRKWFEKK